MSNLVLSGCPACLALTMALHPIRYRRRDDVIEVVGRGRFSAANDGAVVIPLEIVRDASLNDLRGALEEFGASPVYFTETRWEEYDPDTAVRAEPEVLLLPEPGSTQLEVSAVMYREDGAEPPEGELRRLVSPVLDRFRANWSGVWTDGEYATGLIVGVIASIDVRRRTVGELFELGSDLSDLLTAYSGAGELTARSVFDVVRGGRAAVLVGQREGPWLDAKEDPYPVQTEGQKFELAKDVAAFANMGRGALIVLGLRTSRDRNGDVIDAPRPFPLNDMNVEAFRDVLRDRIVPAILDIEVGVVEARAGRGYGYIFIPEQPPELLPYVVAGTLIGGTVAGAHVSVPYRAGEDTAFADAARVHGLIVAGRVALRR
jgi:hypothetical protein